MKSLLYLLPYLKKYRRTLVWGLATVVGSNLFTVLQPKLVGNAIDDLKAGLESGNVDTGSLLTYAGLIVALAIPMSMLFAFTGMLRYGKRVRLRELVRRPGRSG